MMHRTTLILLGGGIAQENNTFIPVDTDLPDTFSRFGGALRITAAVALTRHNLVKNIICTMGTSPRNKRTYGPQCPSIAACYADAYQQQCKHASLITPPILLDTSSTDMFDTLGSTARLMEQFGIIQGTVIANEYQLPRIHALWKLHQRHAAHQLLITFQSAEQIVTNYHPGMYDQAIQSAYAGEEIRKRLEEEQFELEELYYPDYRLARA